MYSSSSTQADPSAPCGTYLMAPHSSPGLRQPEGTLEASDKLPCHHCSHLMSASFTLHSHRVPTHRHREQIGRAQLGRLTGIFKLISTHNHAYHRAEHGSESPRRALNTTWASHSHVHGTRSALTFSCTRGSTRDRAVRWALLSKAGAGGGDLGRVRTAISRT